MREVFQDADAETGIKTTVHADESRVVLQKTEDVEPHLLYAKGLREATEGQRWGEGRVVGTVPLSVCSQFMRQDGRLDAKRLTAWIRENPQFICFDRFR
jgi:hypothetical protein